MHPSDRPLTDRDRAILDFERFWLVEEGSTSKEQAIRARLDLSKARYNEVLNDLLDHPGAHDYDPLVVRRRRRQRDERRRARFEGRHGGSAQR